MFLIKLKRIDKLIYFQRSFIKYASTKNADQYGIEDVSSRDVMGTKERDIDEEEFERKYSYISNLKRQDNEEKILDFPHGHIRFDKDNIPKYHGQFDEDNKKIKYDLQSLEHLVTDNQLEKDSPVNNLNDNKSITKDFNLKQIKERLKEEELSLASLLDNKNNKEETLKKDVNFKSTNNQQFRSTNQIKSHDKPYRIKVDISNVNIYDFEPIRKDYSTAKLKFNVNLLSNRTDFKFSTQWSNWIERDGKFAESPLANLLREEKLLFNTDQRFNNKYDDLKAGLIDNDKNLYTPLKSVEEINEELEELNNENKLEDKQNEETEKDISMNIKAIFEEDPLKVVKNMNEEQDNEMEEQESKEIPLNQITALDYLRKIKNKEIEIDNKSLNRLINKKSKETSTTEKKEFKPKEMEYDSKGFKNYKNQIFNLYNLNDVDKALFLESEVIFNNFGIIAINKPYGLITLGDKDNSKKGVKFDTFIKEFTQLILTQDKDLNKDNTFDDLNNPILYPIFKLDKDCTGVYILAKNKDTAKRVHELFKNRNVSLFYDVITKNIPKLEKATIDIPIEMDKNDLKYRRMILKPDVPKELELYVRPSKFADKAITNYKILKTHKSAAYLELNPQTSVRHQLRVHLGHGLRTPILGDHIYDNPTKVDYQKLPLDMLLNLNVRPTKTMHIPLHLHCKMIILNQFNRNNRDLFLKADLPNFFKDNLKSLKLN